MPNVVSFSLLLLVVVIDLKDYLLLGYCNLRISDESAHAAIILRFRSVFRLSKIHLSDGSAVGTERVLLFEFCESSTNRLIYGVAGRDCLLLAVFCSLDVFSLLLLKKGFSFRENCAVCTQSNLVSCNLSAYISFTLNISTVSNIGY